MNRIQNDARHEIHERPVVRPQPTSLDRTFPTFRSGSVVDLFCGVGGLSHGFVLEGFKVAAGIDADSSCRYAYERNNGARFLEWNVEGLTGEMVNGLFISGEPRILVGCAPCQPFSTYTQSRIDAKWRLLEEFERIIRETLPDIVSMENVPRLAKFRNGELFGQFVKNLKSNGYSVWWDVVECASYGVPQTRKRLVLLASMVGDIELVSPTHTQERFATVAEIIGDLPPLTAGEQHLNDPLHRASGLSATNLARIKAAQPGGSWKEWDKTLVTPCHKKASGRGYASVYGRMTWDDLAPTITTQCYGFGNGRFGHPEQDRAISLREAALLQTFPGYYEFFEPGKKWFTSVAGRWIGNAVPVELARAVARSIARALEDSE